MASVTVTLSDKAYSRLKRLKEPGDSFSDVILRELPEPCDTAGEVLESLKQHPPAKANAKLRARMLSGRARARRKAA